MVEDTVHRLMLELPRKVLPELLLRRIRFRPLNLSLSTIGIVSKRGSRRTVVVVAILSRPKIAGLIT